LFGRASRIEVGAVYKIYVDGRKDTFIFPESIICEFRALTLSIQNVNSDGTIETHYPADPILEWVKIADKNEDLRKALRLLSIPAASGQQSCDIRPEFLPDPATVLVISGH
jgi:hypothetical protein